jgi:diguanylate cyclase (GGDEF)-like protein
MSGPGGRRRLGFALAATAALLAALVAAQTAVLLMGRKDAETQLESSARGVAVSVAHTLSLDAEGYREFARTKDADSAYYKKMRGVLEAIKNDAGVVRFIDTERPAGAGAAEVLLDAEPVGGPDYLRPGEIVWAAGRKRGMIEAGAPIVAGDGEVLGAVCVDVERKRVFDQFRRTVLTLAAADLAFACLIAAVLLRFSDAALRWLFTGGGPSRDVSRRIEFRNGLALIVLEPDGLGRLGKAHGRPFVERAMSAVSEAVRGQVRPGDQFVRYGKRGFALIVADPAAGSALDIAERMRADVENAPMFIEDKDEHVRLTVSIGVAIGDGLSRSADGLVGNAERALAEAKAEGNAVSVFGRWRGGVPA